MIGRILSLAIGVNRFCDNCDGGIGDGNSNGILWILWNELPSQKKMHFTFNRGNGNGYDDDDENDIRRFVCFFLLSQRFEFMRLKGISLENGQSAAEQIISAIVVDTLSSVEFDAIEMAIHSHTVAIYRITTLFISNQIGTHIRCFVDGPKIYAEIDQHHAFSTSSNANNGLCTIYLLARAFTNRFHIKQITKRDTAATEKKSAQRRKK